MYHIINDEDINRLELSDIPSVQPYTWLQLSQPHVSEQKEPNVPLGQRCEQFLSHQPAGQAVNLKRRTLLSKINRGYSMAWH